jgi:hypothetical protein
VSLTRKASAGTGARTTVKRKKNITTAGTIPGLLDDECALPNEERGLRVAKRTRLRLFQLKNAEEKTALRRLCSRLKYKRGFQTLVRAHLQLVADSVSPAKDSDKHRGGTKPSQIVRGFNRAAKKVRKFVGWIQKRVPAESWSGSGLIPPIMPAMPPQPVRELNRYADYLEECEKFLQSRRWPPRNKPPRNRPRPETHAILQLAEFVKRSTGQDYWGSVAILLRRPTGVNFSKASFKELVGFPETKPAGLVGIMQFGSPAVFPNPKNLDVSSRISKGEELAGQVCAPHFFIL